MKKSLISVTLALTLLLMSSISSLAMCRHDYNVDFTETSQVSSHVHSHKGPYIIIDGEWIQTYYDCLVTTYESYTLYTCTICGSKKEETVIYDVHGPK